MALAFDARILLAAASGVLLGALAVLLLVVRRRGANVPFAIFAAAWGLQIVVGNLSRATTDAGLARVLLLLTLAFASASYLALLAFVRAPPDGRGRGSVWVALVASAPPAAVALLLALAPDLLLAGLVPRAQPAGTYAPDWTLLSSALVGAPGFGAFFYAVWMFLRRREEARTTLAASRATVLLAAFSLYAANVAGSGLVRGILAPQASDAVLLVVFLAGAVVLGVVAWRLARVDATRLLALAIVVPFVAGASGALSLAYGLAELETLGLWRILAVGLLVYGILRYQVFDIDLRLKRSLPLGAGPLAFVLLLLGLAPVVGILLPLPVAPGVAQGHALALALAAVGSVPLAIAAPRLSERLFPGAKTDPEYLYARKVEVYQTALEGILAHGEPDDRTKAWLASLRRHLGLSERDHRVLELAARGHLRTKPLVGLGGPAVQAAKYEVLATLGQGTFGTAHLARHSTLERLVVLKELRRAWLGNPEAERAFIDEARRLARIEHPHVVQVHDVEVEGGAVFMVLEHLAGGSLQDEVERRGPMPLPRASAILDDVLSGLEAIHAARIVHRDLSPGNVFLDEASRAKVGDLGVALDLARSGTQASHATRHPGTLPFMSPEQAAGGRVDARSDLFGAAAVFHYMLTGRPPGGSATGRRAPPPEVAAFLARGLAASPTERFASAEEMRGALSALLGRVAAA